ncbi:uncharacterized protein Tco025E_10293 [Trypanosoma conorhini]|uniref:Uncharacterized protein n=1 Tax=Trypanosoma conorhini TaxID=83891 RepID=A0A3R7N1R4_9TRYP|nr:uncharacterized protein Tco025E_10293 [Trypanosoma conorhini]RNE94903.1 hypothetical protein Tco025E_10293 [Trypanosoma conorhini]
MKLVRRARKSIRERRMKACLNDLSANLEKVEMRVFRQQKKERERKRRAAGVSGGVPRDVLMGKMNPELYEVECRLHREAGLPPPPPPEGWAQASRSSAVRRIGFVEFGVVAAEVLRRRQRVS